MNTIRRRAIEGIRAGDVFTVERIFTLAEVVAFTRLSRDRNPIHSDQRFIEAKGFDSPICHGLLVGCLITEIGGQMAMLAAGMNFRFRRPVYPGERVTCRLEVLEVDERSRAKCAAVITNPAGETVIECELFGRVPGPEERRILAATDREGDPVPSDDRDARD